MAPTPADHLDAARRAVALVALAERGDRDGFAMLLADVADPETAGAIVYGLVQLTRATLTLAGVTDPAARIELLDGLVVDTARGEAG